MNTEMPKTPRHLTAVADRRRLPPPPPPTPPRRPRSPKDGDRLRLLLIVERYVRNRNRRFREGAKVFTASMVVIDWATGDDGDRRLADDDCCCGDADGAPPQSTGDFAD